MAGTGGGCLTANKLVPFREGRVTDATLVPQWEMVGWILKLSVFVVKLGHPSLFLGVSWVSHGGLGEPEELERDSDLGGGLSTREENEGER